MNSFDKTLAYTYLFYLLTNADGKVDEKEMNLGITMVKHENLDAAKFDKQLLELTQKDNKDILADCLQAMKKLSKENQIRVLAWICVLANSDGFMDRNEWALIYNIYHEELHLDLKEIMEAQKDVNKIAFGKSSTSFGIKVN